MGWWKKRTVCTPYYEVSCINDFGSPCFSSNLDGMLKNMDRLIYINWRNYVFGIRWLFFLDRWLEIVANDIMLIHLPDDWPSKILLISPRNMLPTLRNYGAIRAFVRHIREDRSISSQTVCHTFLTILKGSRF